MRLLLLLLLLQLDMVIRVLNNVFSPVALRQLYAYADANRSRSKKTTPTHSFTNSEDVSIGGIVC